MLSIFSFVLAASVAAQTIADILSRPISGTNLVWAAIKDAPSAAVFSSSGNLTIFAPTDNALLDLKASYPDLYDATLKNPSDVEQLVKYHTVKGFDAHTGCYKIVTELGKPAIVNVTQASLRLTGGLNRTALVIYKVVASNGIVYFVDNVLIPPLALSITAQVLKWTGMLNTIKTAKLDTVIDTVANSTFFVPTNDAIDGLLGQVSAAGYTLSPVTLSVIVDFHIVKTEYYYDALVKAAFDPFAVFQTSLPGEIVTPTYQDNVVIVQGQTGSNIPAAHVTSTEVLVAGGVAYVIDHVLIPSNKALLASLTGTEPVNPK